MRTLAITQNITLDGAVEMLGDWFDPQAQGEEDLADVLEEIRRQDDAADALLVGRRDGRALIEAGLVDEYRLFVYPVVQGSGRRLFPDGYQLSRLRLVDSRVFSSGITLQRYSLTRG